MITTVLLGFALVVVYALFVLVRPVGKCRKCHGERVLRRGRSAKPCPRCKASGKRRRFGATAVHRFAWSVVLGRVMERRRERRDS